MIKGKYIFAVFLVLLVLGSLAFVSADSSIGACETGKCPNSESYCVYFFYGQGCPHCANVEPLIEDLEVKYTNFTFHKLEIYFNSSNQELFQDFVSRYNIERAGIPAIFIGDRALIGDKVIGNDLEFALQYYSSNTPICPLSYNKTEATTHDISPTRSINLTIGAVIIAALADSINPCAFAVLIFLLIYLSSIASKKRMIKVGLTYIATVFVVYFLSGLGLFIFVQSIGITHIVFNIAAVVSIVAGLINIKDFFWYGKGISLAIPESAKPSIEKYIHFATAPAAIILGILVSMVELPCTGGVYLAILSLLASNLTKLQAIPWLLFYNFIFVLPLLIVLIIVVFGFEAGKADKVRLEKRKWLRLIMGLVMVGLGLAMLLGLFG